jgi:hypothetical protein
MPCYYRQLVLFGATRMAGGMFIDTEAHQYPFSNPLAVAYVEIAASLYFFQEVVNL